MSFRHTKVNGKRVRDMTSKELREVCDKMIKTEAKKYHTNPFLDSRHFNILLFDGNQQYRSMQKERALRDKQLRDYKPK